MSDGYCGYCEALYFDAEAVGVHRAGCPNSNFGTGYAFDPATEAAAKRLADYAQHEPWCRTRFDDRTPSDNPPGSFCSCGLAELLAEAAKEK